ncbi:MAG: hypothetical protein R2787_00205 [Saprospiraceae bacterium]
MVPVRITIPDDTDLDRHRQLWQCSDAVQKVTVQDTTPPVFDNKPAGHHGRVRNVPAPEVVTATDNMIWMWT